jgi:hypothetical protein
MISMRTQNVRVRSERDGRASETPFGGLRSLRGSHALGKTLGNLKKIGRYSGHLVSSQFYGGGGNSHERTRLPANREKYREF